MKIKNDDIFEVEKKRVFTHNELEKFHEELKKYRISLKLQNGTSVSYVDYRKLHVVKGTMPPDGAVILSEVSGDDRFQRLENKIRQYEGWLASRNTIKKEIGKQLDALISLKGVGQEEIM